MWPSRSPPSSYIVPTYRVPQKKVGLVENQLWQILLLIVRNPWALLHKSKNRQNFQMNGPKISANTAKRAHHSSDRAPCPPASFKILENSWAGGLNALCTLKKLGEGKRSKNSCPWGKKLVDGSDLCKFRDILQLCFCLWGFLKSKAYCPCPANLNELQDNPSWETMVRRVMLDMKARTVKCIAAGGGHFEK